jgi:hypothetical protein
MNENVYYIIAVVVMLIAVVAIVTGVRNVIAESKQVWSMLRDSFGVSSDDFSTAVSDKGTPGKLVVLNQEFLGGATVVERGILFRQDFMNRYDLLLFPWDSIQDFKAEQADQFTATFAFEQNDGALQLVRIPWSDALDSQLAHIRGAHDSGVKHAPGNVSS